MKKKKPNYKLRRDLAKLAIIIIIIIPIILINKTKIMHAPIYLNNMKYSKLITTFFNNGYDTDEVTDILDKLRKKKLIDKVNKDYIIELGNKGYNHNTINYVILNFNKTETRIPLYH